MSEMEAGEGASDGMEVENDKENDDDDDGYRHNDDDLHDNEEDDDDFGDDEDTGAHSAAPHAPVGGSSQQIDQVPLPVGWRVGGKPTLSCKPLNGQFAIFKEQVQLYKPNGRAAHWDVCCWKSTLFVVRDLLHQVMLDDPCLWICALN